MGRGLVGFVLFAVVGGLLTGGAGCGSKATSPSGTAGAGGGTAGAAGLDGMGGGAGADFSSCGGGTTGTSGDAVGPMGSQTPQEVNDVLLNAPTFRWAGCHANVTNDYLSGLPMNAIESIWLSLKDIWLVT